MATVKTQKTFFCLQAKYTFSLNAKNDDGTKKTYQDRNGVVREKLQMFNFSRIPTPDTLSGKRTSAITSASVFVVRPENPYYDELITHLIKKCKDPATGIMTEAAYEKWRNPEAYESKKAQTELLTKNATLEAENEALKKKILDFENAKKSSK